MRRWAAQASRVSPLVSKPRNVASAAPRLESSAPAAGSAICSALFLQMRLEEPEVLVYLPGNPRKEVRRIRIAQLIGIGDGRPYRLAVHRQLRRQVEQMILAGGDAQRVVLQLAALRSHGNSAFGGASQAGDALRDLVDLFEHRVGNLVEQFVQGDEVGTLHVPMRLLDLALQIDGISQAIVQDDNDIAADFLR